MLTKDIPITVQRVLKRIEFTQVPDSVYYEGDKISDIEITAYYDKTSEVVTDSCVFTPALNTPIAHGTTEISVDYTENGITKSISRPITVYHKLVKIEATVADGSNIFDSGDKLTLNDLEVTAYYSDGSTADITNSGNLEIFPELGTTLDSSVTKVTFSYTEEGNEDIKTYDLPIQILDQSSPVDHIEAIIPNNSYESGDKLDLYGAKVYAVKSSGQKELVTNYTISPDADTVLTEDNTEVTVSYTYTDDEGTEHTLTTTVPITVTRVLDHIEITQTPERLVYDAGETVDTTGIEVTAHYNSGNTEIVTDKITTSPDSSTALYENITYYTVNYTEGRITKSAQQNITVNKVFDHIEVDSSSTIKTSYRAGEQFTSEGLKVNAVYTSGNKEEVTDKCTLSLEEGKKIYENEDGVSNGKLPLIISYVEGSKSSSIHIDLTITRVLADMVIAEAPSRTSYISGELLDITGLRVSAIFNSGAVENVTNKCILDPANGTRLYDNITGITISYTEGGITKTLTQPLTVTKAVQQLIISKNPAKMNYFEQEAFDPTGIKVLADYGTSTKDVTNDVVYSIAVGDPVPLYTDAITISYTENNITTPVDLDINVYRKLNSIYISGTPKTNYVAGDKLDLSDIIVYAKYAYGNDTELTSKSSLTYTPTLDTVLYESNNNVRLSYTEPGNENPAILDIPITVEKKLKDIYVSQNPRTSYNAGDKLSLIGLQITAEYTSGTTEVLSSGFTTDIAEGTVLYENNTQVLISYAQPSNNTKTTTLPISVEKVVDSIQITTKPTKTSYKVGEYLDLTGMVVKATYNSGVVEDVTSKVKTDPTGTDKLTTSDIQVTVSYEQPLDNIKSTFFNISVAEGYSGIEITASPNKTSYVVGDTFSTEGMVVSRVTTSGSKEYITDYIITDNNGNTLNNGDVLSYGITSFTVTATVDGIKYTATQNITVSRQAEELIITQTPTKRSYSAGDVLDFSDLGVAVRYADGSQRDLTRAEYTLDPEDGSTLDETINHVTVSYTEGGSMASKDIDIVVDESKDYVKSIEVTHLPNKTTYTAGQSLIPDGIVVIGDFNKSGKQDVTTDVSYDPSTKTTLTTSDTEVTVTYIDLEGNTTYTTFPITVNADSSSGDDGDQYYEPGI